MSPDPDLPALLAPRLAEAVDVALLEGLIKITSQGAVEHAPFALVPAPVAPALHARMEALTAPFNRLVHALVHAPAFLADVLAPAAAVDPFTARLLALAAEHRGSRSLFMAVTRSDYFVHRPALEDAPAIRQVELNTISASYPGLAGRVARLHRHLLQGGASASQLVANDPMPGIADAFAEAHRRYGHPEARVLMVVQPGETNVFDQRLLEMALLERGLVTRRRSLGEIAVSGALREGHLVVGGEVMAIAYFRAAYGPEDFADEDAFRARALVEAASVVAIPDLYMQLAGAKKVQQALTDSAVLARFLDAADAAAVAECFAGQYDLEQPLAGADGAERPAWQVALDRPADFVLKPQREGGGHNHFDDALAARVAELTPAERPAHILMERIRPERHPSILVRERQARPATAVSEVGRFGVSLAEGSRIVLNQDVGYLVRSKGHETQEGGVSAGFGFLDSLLLQAGDAP